MAIISHGYPITRLSYHTAIIWYSYHIRWLSSHGYHIRRLSYNHIYNLGFLPFQVHSAIASSSHNPMFVLATIQSHSLFGSIHWSTLLNHFSASLLINVRSRFLTMIVNACSCLFFLPACSAPCGTLSCLHGLFTSTVRWCFWQHRQLPTIQRCWTRKKAQELLPKVIPCQLSNWAVTTKNAWGKARLISMVMMSVVKISTVLWMLHVDQQRQMARQQSAQKQRPRLPSFAEKEQGVNLANQRQVKLFCVNSAPTCFWLCKFFCWLNSAWPDHSGHYASR